VHQVGDQTKAILFCSLKFITENNQVTEGRSLVSPGLRHPRCSKLIPTKYTNNQLKIYQPTRCNIPVE